MKMFIPLQRVLRRARRQSSNTPLAANMAPATRNRGFRHSDDGVAAIEFAFIAPIMLAMLLGVIDVSNAVSQNWRMVQLNRTLADLTAQSRVLSNTDVDKIFAASTATLVPYSGTPPSMVIASVVVNSAGSPRVCWIEGRIGLGPGPVPFAVGNVFPDLSAAMRVPGTSYIVSRVKMQYTGYVSPDFGMTANWLYYKPRAGYVGGASGAEQVVRNQDSNAC